MRAQLRPSRMAARRTLEQRRADFGSGPYRSTAIVSLASAGCVACSSACVAYINSLRRTFARWGKWPVSMRNDGQLNARAILGVVINPHARGAHLGRSYFRFASLQVARKMRKKGSGNLNANPMAGAENVAGQHAVERELINLAGLEQFRLRFFVAIACSQQIQSRAHQIKCGAVRRDIEEPHP